MEDKYIKIKLLWVKNVLRVIRIIFIIPFVLLLVMGIIFPCVEMEGVKPIIILKSFIPVVILCIAETPWLFILCGIGILIISIMIKRMKETETM